MDTIVLKFGGSSLADNLKLNIVADKIINYKKKGKKIVVIVSAQGKTTDKLIKEAEELSAIPSERELDALISTGEDISAAKLAILLQELGYKAISLTGWQAGIYTSTENQNSKINYIDNTRIKKELKNGKIVIITGFQGINNNIDITTLGRGGSDTSAVAIANALNAKECYIFSDVDGVYSTDPNKINNAIKIKQLSYDEMLEISSEGAKVLHNRCIEIGKKYKIPIVTKSTFNNRNGSIINEKIEDTQVKSIVKNDKMILINLKRDKYNEKDIINLIEELKSEKIMPNNIFNNSTNNLNISLLIKDCDLKKYLNLLNKDLKKYQSYYKNISKISIIGYGILNNDLNLKNTLKIIKINNLDILNLFFNESKIEIIFKEKISDSVLEQLHETLINQK